MLAAKTGVQPGVGELSAASGATYPHFTVLGVTEGRIEAANVFPQTAPKDHGRRLD
jgi:hypothetical protein